MSVLTCGIVVPQAAMEQAGSDGREGSPPGIIRASTTPHANAAAGQLTASRPEAAEEDDSGLKGGAVSRYETSPPVASSKRASSPMHFVLLHMCRSGQPSTNHTGYSSGCWYSADSGEFLSRKLPRAIAPCHAQACQW